MTVKATATMTLIRVLDGADGSTIWTTTTAPVTPNYTFTISKLVGPSNQAPKVGDVIIYSYYRYTVTSIGSTTLLAGSRVSIRGAAGANGQSVFSITEQWAINSSKTDAPIESLWHNSLPEWEKDKYIWTRLKIDYVNPTKTEYTEPVLDTVNNALNEVYDSGVILPSQKYPLLIKLSEITEEYNMYKEVSNLAEYQDYKTAYDNLRAILTSVTANLGTYSEIDTTEFKTLNDGYSAAANALREAIDKNSQDQLTDLNSRVTSAEQKITDDAIISTVTSSETYQQGVLDKLTSLEQTNNEFTAKIEKNIDRLDELENSKIMSYFKFADDGSGNGYTELGSSIDGMKLRQYRDRIAFMNGELELAYFANNAMVVDRVNVNILNLGENYELKHKNNTVLQGWYHGGQ